MRKLIAFLGVFIVVAGAGLAYLVLGGDLLPGPVKTSLVTDQEAIDGQVLVFVRNPYKDDYGMARIAGYLENNGETVIVRAKLEIELRDRDGNRQEIVQYEVTNIDPTTRKTFDANAGTIPDTRQATVKVVELEVAAP